ncbi:MAG: hypothetical protein U0Q11_27560 [Vicinamibacterales bacterium]
MFGWLESPIPLDADAPILVSGWAFSRGSRLVSVSVRMDAELVPVEYGRHREDVRKTYSWDDDDAHLRRFREEVLEKQPEQQIAFVDRSDAKMNEKTASNTRNIASVLSSAHRNPPKVS